MNILFKAANTSRAERRMSESASWHSACTLGHVIPRLFAALVAATVALPACAADALPGMPPVLNRHDIYAADTPNNFSPVVKNFPARIYVPNTGSNTLTIIDPKTYKVIGRYRTGK